MLQFFRSFQWAGTFVVLACALALRAVWFVVDVAELADHTGLGPWGKLLDGVVSTGVSAWVLGVACICVIGVFGSFTIQHYRLVNTGLIPAVVAVVLGSSAIWWLGFSPYLVAAICLAAAAQRLFEGYRYQGAALPVYDCGLLLGAGWLIATPFLWFAIWAGLSLAQLRKFVFREQINLLFGVLTFPFLYCLYSFLFAGDVSPTSSALLAWNSLFEGCFSWPTLASSFAPIEAGILARWQPLLLLAIPTALAIAVVGQLTTRRPIQEQRASRMWYTMLLVGWYAILFSTVSGTDSLAIILYPLSVLLGIWLHEIGKKRADLVFLVTLCSVLGGYVWFAMMS